MLHHCGTRLVWLVLGVAQSLFTGGSSSNAGSTASVQADRHGKWELAYVLCTPVLSARSSPPSKTLPTPSAAAACWATPGVVRLAGLPPAAIPLAKRRCYCCCCCWAQQGWAPGAGLQASLFPGQACGSGAAQKHAASAGCGKGRCVGARGCDMGTPATSACCCQACFV